MSNKAENKDNKDEKPEKKNKKKLTVTELLAQEDLELVSYLNMIFLTKVCC
jgi:hypothetical protein|tara:strand:- start:2007 stop:2159 length:153 start_codon:yes stop_codon:yes gene_type:complete